MHKLYYITYSLLFSILLLVGITYSVGAHTAEEILPGTFNGNFVFNGGISGNFNLNGDLYLSGTHKLYADAATGIRINSNHDTVTFINLRDKQGTSYGHVYGSGDGANFGLLDGDGNWNYLHVKDTYTAFRINDAEKVRISPSGNVLNVIGTTQTDYLRVNAQDGVSEGGEIRLDGAGSNNIFYIDNYAGRFRLHSGGEKFTVLSSNGNVGIGTSNPQAKLEVVGGAIKATGGLIIETRTSDPASPVVGQIWLRTDIS